MKITFFSLNKEFYLQKVYILSVEQWTIFICQLPTAKLKIYIQTLMNPNFYGGRFE